MLSLIKTVFKGLTLALAMTMVMMPCSALWAGYKGTITSTYLNVRPEPGKDKPPIDALRKGFVVKVLERGDYWIKIKYNNIVGYVSHKHISVEKDKESIMGLITGNNLNIRSGPGTNKASVGRLNKGIKVKILDKGEWVKIKYDNLVGYVSNDYIKINNNLSLKENKSEPKVLTKSDTLTENKIKTLKKKKTVLKNQIAVKQAQIVSYSDEEDTLLIELNHVEQELKKSNKILRKIKSEIKLADEKIEQTREYSKELMKEIAINESYVAKRLTALYKLKQLGASNILCSASSFTDVVVRYKNLEYILDHDDSMQKKLLMDNERLIELFEDLKRKREKKAKAEKQYQKVNQTIKLQMAERSEILNKIRAEKSRVLANLKLLRQHKERLDNTILSLGKESVKQYISSVKNNLTFLSFKGRLDMPVNGRVVNRFGSYKNPKFDVVQFRNGVTIKADKGEPIRAVCSGRLLYADWFKGYGNMIIIDHGDSYYTVYAHADEIFKQKGDAVESGEVVGTLGDTGSTIGPNLYFEVRHHGKPINPLRWLRKS
ncbi:murein hydrolase activator [Candidatus Magnetomoraceae bacterium gMMP-15]